MKIAVEGCAHGDLELIYRTLQELEKQNGIKIDLLLCCGDFQATRNLSDLETMAVPRKFREIGSFYKYYSGELQAPILTIFIGGNHEAMNHMQELPYGGWVAPNIYYMGYASVIRVNGIRIAGLSGIFKPHDYHYGRFEFPPYSEASKRSVYHIRQLDVYRLMQLTGDIDIFMSHDWPSGIYEFGDKSQLLRLKPHFRSDMENGTLGNKPAEELLMHLKPTYWFAAHLHCKFAAVVPHVGDDNDMTQDLRYTKFLALDKCLPGRRFLQLIDFNLGDKAENTTSKIEYDLEWLSILNVTNHLLGVRRIHYYMPENPSSNFDRVNFTPTNDELQSVRSRFNNDLRIPSNFCRFVEPYKDTDQGYVNEPEPLVNPQTTLFCTTLGVDDPLTLAMLQHGRKPQKPVIVLESTPKEPLQVATSSKEDSGNIPPPKSSVKQVIALQKSSNADEILVNTSSEEESEEPQVQSIMDQPRRVDTGESKEPKDKKQSNTNCNTKQEAASPVHEVESKTLGPRLRRRNVKVYKDSSN